MDERIDILLDDNNDLLIENGDLATGDSHYQNVKLIMQAAPGHWKQYPTLGANVMNFVNGSSPELMREVKLQLLADGYDVKRLSVGTGGEIEVEI